MSTLTLDTLVKVTRADGSACHGGTGTWTLGRWRYVTPPLHPCGRGLHVMTIAQAPLWLGPRIGLVEVAGERIDQADKVVVQRARVTGWLTTWDERTARLFAADCAEHVLPIFESARPDEADRGAAEAAREAARAARAAAWAARAAAGAARAAAEAAGASELRWQSERLLAYLRGEVA